MFLRGEQLVYQWREIAPHTWLITNGVPADFEARLLACISESPSATAERLAEFLQYAPGHFSLVIDREDWQLALAGRHQTFPVFFAPESERLQFATDARLFNRNLKTDSEATWFANAGFVPGRETLHEDVLQLHAGELVWSRTGSGEAIFGFYFRHWHTTDELLNGREASDQLREICLEIGRYVIVQAGGAPIAISLSGGYDSRLLAILLKELGYSDVHCFTYGNPNGFEAKRARQTAESLGFKWAFVPYDDRNAQLFFDEQAERYRAYAHRGSMLPYEQEYIAIRELKRQGRVPEDSLMVIGHFADLTAGKSVPDPLEVRQLMRSEFDPTYLMCRSRLFPQMPLSKQAEPIFLSSLEAIVEDINRQDVHAIIAQLENWKTLNFTVKHPNQSIRVQEFFGYRWCMPFMHPDWLRFWYRAPFDQRYKRKLFRETVERAFFQPHGIETSAPDIDHLIDRSSTLVRIRNLTPKPVRRLVKRLLKPTPENQSGMDALRRQMHLDLGQSDGFGTLHSNAQYAHWLLDRLKNGRF